jgi:hypothetical protein
MIKRILDCRGSDFRQMGRKEINEKIEQAITLANKHFGGLIIAGKMHNAGTAGKLFDLDAFSRFAEAGADVILFPAPGTVPGVR